MIRGEATWRSIGTAGSPFVIPAFGPDGKLPIGRHTSDPAEVDTRLVAPFPMSLTRQDLYDGWRRRRQEIADVLAFEMEWLDGSFATSKIDPSDVDVVTFLDGERLDRLSVEEKRRVFEAVQGPKARAAFGCDAYFVTVWPHQHPSEPLYHMWRGYWDVWWSHDRDTEAEKGYLDIRGEP